MTITQPPVTVRRWLAGLLELTGDLIQHIGYVVSHVGDGLEAIADHLHPTTEPDTDEDIADEDGSEPTRTFDIANPGQASTAGWARVIDGDHIHYLPLADSIDHDRSDDCPCGPAMRCQQTGRGDVWHIGHHRLAPTDTPTTEGA